MKAFKVTGSFRMGRRVSPFIREVAAPDKDSAVERTVSDLGSKHKVKRYDIRIVQVNELKPEEVKDGVVRFKMGLVEQ